MPTIRRLRGLLCPGFQRLSHADRDAEHSRQGALRAFYAQHRFNNPLLKAELLSRTVMGNKVFDHELIHGLPEPIESVAVFEVKEGLIQTAWFYFPLKPDTVFAIRPHPIAPLCREGVTRRCHADIQGHVGPH